MVRFYFGLEDRGFYQNIEVNIEGYSDECGEVVIEARSVNGSIPLTGTLEEFAVAKPGRFARPLTYRDLRHFRCLEVA